MSKSQKIEKDKLVDEFANKARDTVEVVRAFADGSKANISKIEETIEERICSILSVPVQ
jgi:hypothetical protein